MPPPNNPDSFWLGLARGDAVTARAASANPNAGEAVDWQWLGELAGITDLEEEDGQKSHPAPPPQEDSTGRPWFDPLRHANNLSNIEAFVLGESKSISRFVFFSWASTAVALAGLINDSTAVVIASMLIAPFMVALLASAFAILIRDGMLFLWAFCGFGIVAFTCWYIAYLLGVAKVCGQQLPASVLVRGDFLYWDALVALCATPVTAYYVSTKQRDYAAMGGVGIAVALLPPLLSSGLALGYGNISVHAWSSSLFMGNVGVIILTAWGTFRLLTFRSPKKVDVEPRDQREAAEQQVREKIRGKKSELVDYFTIFVCLLCVVAFAGAIWLPRLPENQQKHAKYVTDWTLRQGGDVSIVERTSGDFRIALEVDLSKARQVRDEDLRHIRDLYCLVSLNLDNTQVTSDGLDKLLFPAFWNPMPSLKELSIRNTAVDQQAIEQIKTRLPNLTIVTNSTRR